MSHFVVLDVLFLFVFVEEYSVNIISLHAIEAAKDIHNTLEHNGLMERSGAWSATIRVDSCPGLVVEIKLVYIVESFLVLVNATENKHRVLSCAC